MCVWASFGAGVLFAAVAYGTFGENLLLNLDARHVLPVDAQIADSVRPTAGRDSAYSQKFHGLDWRFGIRCARLRRNIPANVLG